MTGGYRPGWQFWIDVGGTFTDCIACRPDGSLASHKLLSSSVYKGIVGVGSTALTIRDTARTSDPDGFFEGYRLRVLRRMDSIGADRTELVHGDLEIARFDRCAGTLELVCPLKTIPEPGLLYEISSGEEAPITGIRWLMGKRLAEEIGEVEVRLGTTRGTNALLERRGAATALVTTAGFRDVLRIAYQNRPRLFDLEIRLPSDLYREVVELQERLDKDGRLLQPLDEGEVRRQLAELRDHGID